MNTGLYVAGDYVQLLNRVYTDKGTGEVKTKYYVVLSLERLGVVNVGVGPDEYARLAAMALPMGVSVSGPVEVFGYQNKAYLRMAGPLDVRLDAKVG